MLTIQLNNLKFFAYHGLYDFEKEKGNNFEMNVLIHYLPQTFPITQIEQTINYETVFGLIAQRMNQATPLLETVVMDIAHLILAQFSLAQHVFVSLVKLEPPIKHFNGTVGVSFELNREQL